MVKFSGVRNLLVLIEEMYDERNFLVLIEEVYDSYIEFRFTLKPFGQTMVWNG